MSPGQAPAHSVPISFGRAGEKRKHKKAAGGVLTAKQAPHWPGIAPALGLRAASKRPQAVLDLLAGGYVWGTPAPEVPELLRRVMLRRTKAKMACSRSAVIGRSRKSPTRSRILAAMPLTLRPTCSR